MKVGYLRVSTEEQNLKRQEEAIKKYEVDRIFEEKISGKNTERPELKAMLAYLREGDTLIVESYSRLARSTSDLLNIVDELNKKGVSFISIKENIDTTTTQGKLMLTIFAGLSQFERETILQRQKEGIEIAKREGKYLGRKPIDKPVNYDEVVREWREGKITAVEASKRLGVTHATFYRMVKKF